MPVYLLPLAATLSVLWMMIFDRERWRAFKDRDGGMGPLPPFSRLDTMVYIVLAATMLGTVANTIFRTTEISELTERNTKEMGEVVEKMRDSSDQSLKVLAAMREEAEAARRETAAAQNLALWVGVVTAVLGAILGGVAGAFAAQAIN